MLEKPTVKLEPRPALRLLNRHHTALQRLALPHERMPQLASMMGSFFVPFFPLSLSFYLYF